MDSFFYYFFLLLLMTFFWVGIENRKIKISMSSIYIYTLFITVIFVYPSNWIHMLFMFFWIFFYILGILFVSKKRFVVLKNKVGYLLFFLLVFFFFISGATKLSFLGTRNLSFLLDLHSIRSEVKMSYLEYLFNRSLFILPFIYLFYRKKNIIIRLILVLLALSISLASVQKAPIVFSILSLILFSLLRKSNTINMRKVLVVITSFLGLSILISFIMYQSELGVTSEAVFNRIFQKPGKLSFLAMEMIDKGGKFYYGGASFYTPFEVMGLDRIMLGKENYYYVYGSYIGSANTPSFTGAYADFGFIGVVYAFVLGVILKVYDNTIIKGISFARYPNLTLASYTCSLILSLKLNVTVIGSAFLGEGLFASMFITYLTLGVFSNKLPQLSKSIQ